MTSPFAALPSPPYYVVIFASTRTSDDNDYNAMANRMSELSTQQPGYLGAESLRDAERFGITLSYWTTLEAIANWKQNAEHLEAQRRGHRDFYSHFEVKIAKVERSYSSAERQSTAPESKSEALESRAEAPESKSEVNAQN